MRYCNESFSILFISFVQKKIHSRVFTFARTVEEEIFILYN